MDPSLTNGHVRFSNHQHSQKEVFMELDAENDPRGFLEKNHLHQGRDIIVYMKFNCRLGGFSRRKPPLSGLTETQVGSFDSDLQKE